MRKFGLIGFPLEHSFSASYFAEKFKKLRIEASYRNFPLEEIAAFESLLKEEPELDGLNVTVPYKQKIIPYLDALDQTSRSIGAVNTILFCRREGRAASIGYNTDVTGFRRSLEENRHPDQDCALVLGTGGSSAAVIHVLKELQIDYRWVSRQKSEGKTSYEELTALHVTESRLIINTTPLGMHPRVETCPDIPYDGIRPGHLIFDLVYNPVKTRFLEMGEARGAAIVNGYQMLVYQAEASWEIWNRHGGNRHGGNRHGENRHGENRHGENRHGGNRHGGNRHGGNRHGGNRHGGNRM